MLSSELLAFLSPFCIISIYLSSIPICQEVNVLHQYNAEELIVCCIKSICIHFDEFPKVNQLKNSWKVQTSCPAGNQHIETHKLFWNGRSCLGKPLGQSKIPTKTAPVLISQKLWSWLRIHATTLFHVSLLFKLFSILSLQLSGLRVAAAPSGSRLVSTKAQPWYSVAQGLELLCKLEEFQTYYLDFWLLFPLNVIGVRKKIKVIFYSKWYSTYENHC